MRIEREMKTERSIERLLRGSGMVYEPGPGVTRCGRTSVTRGRRLRWDCVAGTVDVAQSA
jgi:hypothetical protein